MQRFHHIRLTVFAATTAACLMSSGLASAEDYGAHAPNSVHVMSPWVREAPLAGRNGAAYFVLHNMSDSDARIIGATSSVSEAVEIHSHIQDGNVMRMRRVDGLDIAREEFLAFAPGGNHIMLIGLAAALKPGDKVPLTLTFEGGKEITIEAHVLSHSDAMEKTTTKHDPSAHEGHTGHSGRH